MQLNKADGLSFGFGGAEKKMGQPKPVWQVGMK